MAQLISKLFINQSIWIIYLFHLILSIFMYLLNLFANTIGVFYSATKNTITSIIMMIIRIRGVKIQQSVLQIAPVILQMGIKFYFLIFSEPFLDNFLFWFPICLNHNAQYNNRVKNFIWVENLRACTTTGIFQAFTDPR